MQVVDRHDRALAGQPSSVRGAHALGGAGDQGHPSRQGPGVAGWRATQITAPALTFRTSPTQKVRLVDEEGDAQGDLLGGDEPPKGQGGEVFGGAPGRVRPDQRGVGRARGDGVDADAARSDLRGEAAHQPEDRPLGGGVVRVLGAAADRQFAGNGDEGAVALAEHRRQRGPGQVRRPCQVDSQHAPPLVGRDVRHRQHLVVARDVDRRRDGTQPVLHLPDGLGHRGRVGDVDLHTVVGRGGRLQVEAGHRPAAGAELGHDSPSDPAGSSGDHCGALVPRPTLLRHKAPRARSSRSSSASSTSMTWASRIRERTDAKMAAPTTPSTPTTIHTDQSRKRRS